MEPKKYEFIWENSDSLNDNAMRICRNEGIEFCYIGVTLCTRQDNTWYPVKYENTGKYFDSDPIFKAIIYC